MPPQSDVKLRMASALKQRLKIIAAENGRSMNAEILARIEQSFELDGTARAQALALVNQLAAVLEKAERSDSSPRQ
ncbi:conserved hypothetical protein [Mesorhizobium plurifarium]|uniref:Arc-like DNA binding domain-containing protein n=1 Tax=Mesorhizobium plurifarium TaxID=69974 RepID=A0A0K2VUU3_MESPL|nr:conserved hypothetical protein [Mesorhizobium plurifarium]